MEMYATVTAKLGGNKLDVLCIDGNTRMCLIPGKFARCRRDNMIERNTWLLIGIRDWETPQKDKKEKCDLLEVYSEAEKIKLQNTLNEAWHLITDPSEKAETIQFSDDIQEFRNEVLETIRGEDIDFDDI
jgi:hypothetical protein